MRPFRRLTCVELVELVTGYLEGGLSRRDRIRFEHHVASCPGCDTYLDQMRDTLAVLGRLDHDSLDPAALDTLLTAFRGWVSEEAGA